MENKIIKGILQTVFAIMVLAIIGNSIPNTVIETTSPIDQSALQPLQNQSLGDVPVDLSAIENKTVLQPTGEAQTTMLNKTTVPFEQTTVEGINQTGTQQQGGQEQQQQQQGGQEQQQQQQGG